MAIAIAIPLKQATLNWNPVCATALGRRKPDKTRMKRQIAIQNQTKAKPCDRSITRNGSVFLQNLRYDCRSPEFASCTPIHLRQNGMNEELRSFVSQIRACLSPSLVGVREIHACHDAAIWTLEPPPPFCTARATAEIGRRGRSGDGGDQGRSGRRNAKSGLRPP